MKIWNGRERKYRVQFCRVQKVLRHQVKKKQFLLFRRRL
ncbi:unnamed protein product [Amoebophrya sp. A120]|nr:unnamed protein product [Amoebophrya sp. A120]|eukprot:GSA120T00013913001.1